MKFCWCTIHVNNMKESLKFYQDIVGLEIDSHIKNEDRVEIYFLGKGETKVELMDENCKEKSPIGQDISIGFQVESLNQKMEFIKEKNIPIDSGPFKPDETVQFFYVRDPNGLKVQFVESIIQ